MIWAILYILVGLVAMFVWAFKTGDSVEAIPMGFAWPIAFPIFATLWLAGRAREYVERVKQDREEASRKAAYAKFEVCRHERVSGGVCCDCGGYLESTMPDERWRFRR